MPLVEGALAREWAHWVGVQNAGFPGTIEGSLQLGHLGAASPVRAEDGSLDDLVAYGVVVRATVTFALTDETGEPSHLSMRSMDGMVVMIQGADGASASSTSFATGAVWMSSSRCSTEPGATRMA